MASNTETNVQDFIGELGGGVLEQQLAAVISSAALSTVNHSSGNRKGKVSVELTFSQVSDLHQVIVSSKISSTILKPRGKKQEDDMTETNFFVGKGGKCTTEQPAEEDSGQFTLQKEQDGSVSPIR